MGSGASLKNPSPIQAVMDSFRVTASRFCTMGCYSQAVFVYEQALQVQPDPIVYTDLGCALVALGHLDQAIPAFRKAIELKSDHAAAYYHMGLAYYEMGRDTEALAAFQKT